MAQQKKKLPKLSVEERIRQELGIPDDERSIARRKAWENVYNAYYAEDDADIAPIVTEKTKDLFKDRVEAGERTWFSESKGGFWQTAGGTIGDVAENLLVGIGETAEDIWDSLLTFGANAFKSNVLQNTQENLAWKAMTEGDQAATEYLESQMEIPNKVIENAAKEVAKDSWDSEKAVKGVVQNILGVDLDDYSISGERLDGVVQSAGQVVVSSAGQSIGIPWFLTTGASAFGNEMENALNEGASVEEAYMSAGISAGGEVLTEMLSGGISFGGKTLDEFTTKILANKIASKFWRTAAKLGLDTTGEAAEEWISADISSFGQWLTYRSDEELAELLFSEEAMDAKIEAAIGGGLLGGFSSAGNAVKSATKGIDPVTNLTANEQKVVDSVYEKAISEAEKNSGKKLTTGEKSKLYSDAMDSLQKGKISTDTIEEVLGGEDYKRYKTEIERQESIKKELDELRNTEYGKLTDVQHDRMAELKAFSPNKEMLDTLKSSIDEKIRNALSSDGKLLENNRGSYLSESYNERAKLSKVYEADLSQYDEKRQYIVQKAIDSGILNDTRGAHELVDLVAKVYKDKGVDFDFVNNEKIKNSRFAVDGKTVNGYVENGKIGINIESKNRLNFVVGHEITHVLEGTDLYDSLAKTIKEYAEAKGEYENRLRDAIALYKDVDGYKGEDGRKKIEREITADLVGDYLFSDFDFIRTLSTKNRNAFQKVFDEIKYLYKMATAGSKEARQLERVKKAFEEVYRSEVKASTEAQKSTADSEGKPIDSARISVDESDVSYSLSHNNEIEAGQSAYVDTKKVYISKDELEEAQKVTRAMVDVMMKYSSILPEDKIGKVLTKNGSYDRSVENTTICVRTLAYNEFVDKVQEEIGRPLTQMESFLVSQKMYDIATDPQCLYCYVSLDRKAFNDMLLRYIQDRDTVIAKYNNSDKSKAAIDKLYEEFLHGRKDTKNMKERFNKWLGYVDNSTQLLSLADIATDDRQSVIKANGGILAAQLKDARAYAQSASWSKIQKNYVAYRDEILKLNDAVVKNLNEHYGMRWYSFSDYSAAFIVENMQQITDASIRGLKGLAYTKDTDFAEIFAPSGMNINVSVFVNQDAEGNFFIDEKQSANFEKALALREKYPNVGIVATVTNDEALRWVGEQGWSDVIIPFHIVRTGTDVAEYYKWLNYTSESADTVSDNDMWNAYVDSLNLKSENARKKVSKNIYPNEHHNNKDTYLNLCESRGLSPRFARFAGESWYMKLVNETRLSADESSPLKPNYNLEAAQASFQKFVDKGGYESGWYKDGVDVDAEAAAVAADILAGKKANQVDYGRQDGFVPEDLMAGRKANRQHGQLSLSEKDAAPYSYGDPTFRGNNVALVNDTAPTTEDIAPLPTYNEPAADPTVFDLEQEKKALQGKITEAMQEEDWDTYNQLAEEYQALEERINQMQADEEAFNSERLATLDDMDAPIEQETEYYSLPDTTPLTKKAVVDISRSVRDALGLSKRQMAEVRAIIEEYSASELPSREELYEKIKERFGVQTAQESQGVEDVQAFLRDSKIKVSDTIKGDIADYNNLRKSLFRKIGFGNDGIDVDSAYHELTDLYPAFFPEDIVNPTDQFLRMAEVAKMDKTVEIEYELDSDTLMEAADIIINEVSTFRENHRRMAAEREARHLPKVAPVEDGDIAPVPEAYEAIRPKQQKEPRMARATPEEQASAEILTEEPQTEKKKSRFWSQLMEKVGDKGFVFENLSKKTKNRELEAKWNYIRYAEGNAQTFMQEGADGVSSLKSIVDRVEKSGKTKEFYEYMYHLHNIDRMTLAERNLGENKTVFGDTVTAESSRGIVAQLEAANPEFKEIANEIYAYNKHLRKMLVAGNVISQKTADLWEKMYPHYVPIRRLGDSGLNINVPLDSGKTGVNAPIKKATGGNRDILPMFDTMAQRTLQTYKAVAKNRFGIELKNTLGSVIESENQEEGFVIPNGTRVKASDRSNIGTVKSYNEETGKYSVYFKNDKGQTATVLLDAKILKPISPIKTAKSVDEAIETIDSHESLLQEGKNGRMPTFTVFENGKRVTFEITEDMYDAMKPKSDTMAYTNKFLNTLSNLQRNVLTQYNPVFMLTNAAKDIQDVLINSQHAAKTYANFPKAIAEMATKGKYYTEYMRNGGEQNTYFENETNTFKEERKGIKKIVGMPLDIISAANNVIERLPRLAEYIASRESGRSIEVSMLDAARVTTNFAAGGDVAKFLNRNGATFLNASIQGAMQQVRNIREAKMNGLKGWVGLATKFAIAGLAAEALNHLLWDDDDEYEELSDYVKQNYYVVAKTEDGTFIRIPKGRAVAVIQDAFEQISNAATGDDEVDLKSFLELAVSNLAPNNPIDNNILAPIMQVANNKTWYGEDLVPTRLQDLPAAEQYDESTDELSKWLGETLNYSPYKINYLLDQYSGGLGDVFLPMMTPEAERGDDNNLIAPLIDKFTTDSTMNNQNISDFYDMKEQLTMNANSRNATDEDVLKSKFFNAVNAELSDLYARKREVQNSSLSDSQKYASVRAIQEQINAIARDSLNNYDSVNIEDGYATVGDIHYRLTENEETGETEWKKITDKQLQKQEEVTKGLGISASEYWSNKAEYDYAYESPAKYAVAKAVGGYKAFKDYSSALYDIKADKDSSGKSISGSRKEKVIEWINGLDADYGEKIILFKSEYTADDTYNYEIVDYLNSRDDISYEEMEAILKELGFTVKADGTITW